MSKILVGLSGGVDSAIAAYLLKQQGHDVTCAFMRNWDSLANADIAGNPTLDDDTCPQEKDYQDALEVAKKLELECLRVDFIEEYWQDVFQTFLDEYKKGRTPNPDILCNRFIKFHQFTDYANEMGFEYVATGHYAKIAKENHQYVLQKADDRNKDQSYFLAEINRNILSQTIFPLGTITKPEVREIANKLELNVAKKKDSTGICFIGERHFREFLSNYLPMKPGDILDINTKKVIGKHQGVMYYTIGQRKGLDIGGIGPFFVVGKNVEKNLLYVTDSQHLDLLYSDACIVKGLNWLADRSLPLECQGKFRYRQSDNPIMMEKRSEDELMISFQQPIKAITPGQEAVIYDGDTLVVGGTIETVLKNEQDLMKMVDRISDE